MSLARPVLTLFLVSSFLLDTLVVGDLAASKKTFTNRMKYHATQLITDDQYAVILDNVTGNIYQGANSSKTGSDAMNILMGSLTTSQMNYLASKYPAIQAHYGGVVPDPKRDIG